MSYFVDEWTSEVRSCNEFAFFSIKMMMSGKLSVIYKLVFWNSLKKTHTPAEVIPSFIRTGRLPGLNPYAAFIRRETRARAYTSKTDLDKSDPMTRCATL